MKRKLFAITALTVFIVACSKTDALQKKEANELSSPAKSKTLPAAINFTAPMQFPEGMVYNPFTDRFLVSSIALGTIGSVTPGGVYSPFIQDAALASTAGMEIDKARKRLLVTNSVVQGSLAQLVIYDLNTKNRLFLIDLLALANDGAPHLANDVAVDQHGNAYLLPTVMPATFTRWTAMEMPLFSTATRPIRLLPGDLGLTGSNTAAALEATCWWAILHSTGS